MLINRKMFPTTTLRPIKSGAALAMAISIVMPLSAQDTVVEGKAQRSNTVEARVSYADLDLGNQQNQLLLVSRVRKAAVKLCDIVYHGYAPIEKFSSRCPQNTYRDAKPQIDLAIANAQNGSRVAINLVVARKR